ncbi:diguanylate cyclase [Francisella sp. Scap27]|uniref:sensor domain-containing diguanylate cyclase n=1 Tax=Francisella sp. Scap27 TaxID=2589986 RepID=UPI0015B95ED4|nr:sensor domain-containing diguanylate cyclase [Francisella sp. Scap27]QLE79824.1 diguanylate cyclase [Francisella sp. Scap27]
MKHLCISKLLENISSGVVVYGPDTSIIYANESACDILKVDREDLVSKKFHQFNWEIVDASGENLDKDQLPSSIIRNTNKEKCEMLLGIEYPEGQSNVWIWTKAYSDHGRIVITFIDVTDKYRLPFQQIVDNATNAVMITTAKSDPKLDGPKIIYVNDYFEKLTGYTKKEIVGNTPKILHGKDTDKRRLFALKQAIKKNKAIKTTILNYKKNGEKYWVDLSIFPLNLGFRDEVTHFAGMHVDVTKLKESEIAQKKVAERDCLTGLFNRRGFESITKSYNRHNENLQDYALVMMDIDLFKKINDTYSHAHGDEVIKNIAKVIKKYCRDDDSGVRYGGEEFTLMIVESNKEDALKVAERLRKSVEKQCVNFDGNQINYTISCGIADSNDSKDINECLHYADKALYKAKNNGRNRCEVY